MNTAALTVPERSSSLFQRVFLMCFFVGCRFHLRWGCREVLYDETPEGETYVTGLVMTKVSII